MDQRDLTGGDPLRGEERTDPYGGGPVPPGAFAPREKPQRLPPDVVFADWWRRAVAAVIDGVIVLGLTFVVLAAIGVGFFADGDVGFGDLVVGSLAAILVFAIIMPFYGPLLMARTNGQTLGKMATGCRVVRANGGRCDFGWAVMREVVVKGIVFRVAGVITGGIANVVDWVWPFFDREERALHDFLVDSRVIRS